MWFHGVKWPACLSLSRVFTVKAVTWLRLTTTVTFALRPTLLLPSVTSENSLAFGQMTTWSVLTPSTHCCVYKISSCYGFSRSSSLSFVERLTCRVWKVSKLWGCSVLAIRWDIKGFLIHHNLYKLIWHLNVESVGSVLVSVCSPSIIDLTCLSRLWL